MKMYVFCRINTFLYMCAYMHVCVYVHILMYMCIYVSLSVTVFVHNSTLFLQTSNEISSIYCLLLNKLFFYYLYYHLHKINHWYWKCINIIEHFIFKDNKKNTSLGQKICLCSNTMDWLVKGYKFKPCPARNKQKQPKLLATLIRWTHAFIFCNQKMKCKCDVSVLKNNSTKIDLIKCSITYL